MPSRRLLGSFAAIAALLVTGCASQDTGGSADSDAVDSDVRDAAQAEGDIVIVKNNWTAHEVSTEVAAQVLDAFGFNVEVQTLDSLATWPAMAKADNMINMSVWPPVQKPQMDEWVTEKAEATIVSDAGYGGTEGWYVPTYVIEGDAERGIDPLCPDLPDYKALNECVEAFATSSTSPSGRYLSGDPAWGEYYGDQARIDNLGLDYKMEFAGSEAALAAEIKRAYDRGEPILALMWEPHFTTSRYDLTQIEFPPYSPDCWGSTFACGWEEGPAVKIVSDEFQEKYPLAYEVVDNTVISLEELNELIVRIDGDGLTVEEAVAEWMDANEDVWSAWAPELS